MDTREYLMSKYGATMTPNDVAFELHRHPAHIRALCQSGELPGVQIGNRWHIPTVKIAERIEGNDNV